MTDNAQPVPLTPESRADQVFPTLTPAQIARVHAHGRVREVKSGEVLVDAGEQSTRFFVVKAGEVHLVRQSGEGTKVVAVFGQGQFTGEINILSGRRGFVQIRAARAGEVIEVDRENLLALVQTDSELSDILMRAFILRRVELIAHGFGDVVLVGSNHNAATLRIKEFLTRNGHPYSFVDLERDEDVQELLDHFHVNEAEVPVLICRGETVLRSPTNQEIADCLGFNETIDQTQVRDLVIVGAGPAGLAAAVYGASEGLDVLVVESNSPGGQAASSSKIENYLGFPTGISGQELAARAYTQAQKFGAQVMIMSLGMAASVAPLTTTVMDAVDERHAGIASGINNAVSSTAGLISIAVLGIVMSGVFARNFNASLQSLGLPAETRGALEAQTSRLATITIPDELKDETKQAVKRAAEESFVSGFRFVILVAAALALVSAFFAWLLIEGRARPVGEIPRATHRREEAII